MLMVRLWVRRQKPIEAFSSPSDHLLARAWRLLAIA
jgi:hypothetical protein